MKTKVIDAKGKKIKDIELDVEVFGVTPNIALVHQVVTAERANARQGNAATKTKGMVSGGGIKPHRQKGTGRARAGSIRSPLWKGGGTVFGPRPRKYSPKVPRKMRRLALRSILSAKAKDSEVMVIDKFNFKKPVTKKAKRLLDDIKAPKKVTVVVDNGDDITEKSFRNLSRANVISVSSLSSYYLLDNEALLFSEATLGKITEVLKG